MDAYEAERAELLKSFGKRLKALRAPKFANQEALADAANLHRTHIGFLEQGRREPSLSTLLILSQTLDVSVEKLIEGLAVPEERRPERRKAKR